MLTIFINYHISTENKEVSEGRDWISEYIPNVEKFIINTIEKKTRFEWWFNLKTWLYKYEEYVTKIKKQLLLVLFLFFFI